MSKREGVTILVHGEVWGDGDPHTSTTFTVKVPLPRATLTKLARLPSDKRNARIGKAVSQALVEPAERLLKFRSGADTPPKQEKRESPALVRARQRLFDLHARGK